MRNIRYSLRFSTGFVWFGWRIIVSNFVSKTFARNDRDGITCVSISHKNIASAFFYAHTRGNRLCLFAVVVYTLHMCTGQLCCSSYLLTLYNTSKLIFVAEKYFLRKETVVSVVRLFVCLFDRENEFCIY